MFELPALPYPYDALAPVMSDRTMHFHHDKHHAAYVETTNKLLEAKRASPESLEDVIRGAASSGDKKLFNNAAQAWNHAFFWDAMSAKPQSPEGEVAAAIRGAFGDLGALKTKFVEEGVGHFGSGWVWLCAGAQARLQVITTHDGDDPLVRDGLTPLLVCDLWEHAYYLDHQNDRKGFLEAWFDRAPSWTFAERQFAAARSGGRRWRYPPPGPARQASAAQ